MSSTKPLTYAASMTFFMQSLDTTMLYLALPSIAIALKQPMLNMELVIVLYMLTVIVVTPLSSWLTDRFGVRRAYASAILLFALGSLGCALSNTLFMMSAFRLLQGFGGALMLPIVKVLVLKTAPPNQQFFQLNTITMIGLAGTFIGPVLSGLLIYYASWRYIFLINLPVMLICLYLNYRYIPEQLTLANPFNLKAFLLLALSLTLFVSGLITFNKQQLPLVTISLIILSGLLLFHFYLIHQIKTKQHTRFSALFKLRTFSVSLFSNIGTRIFLSSIPLVISLILQQELNYTPVEVSFVMLAVAIGSILSRCFLPQLLLWFGYRRFLLINTLIAAVVISLFTWHPIINSFYLITAMMFIYGMLSSVLYASMNTLIFSDLNEATYSTGNNILIMSQLVAITLSISLSFAILRLLSTFTLLSNTDCYRTLFIILSIGLMLCCLTFCYLKQHDGKQLLAQN